MVDLRNGSGEFEGINRLQNIATNKIDGIDISKEILGSSPVYTQEFTISLIKTLCLIMETQNKQIKLLKKILKLLRNKP